MELSKRLKAFEELGQIFKKLSEDPSSPILLEAVKLNPWFTEASIKKSMAALSINLKRKSLEKWVSKYPEIEKRHSPKKIGVIIAGNIPLVGFHDLLSVLISGNIFIGKPSSKDAGLHKAVMDILFSIEPCFKEWVSFTEKELKNIDAVIATGSDNSARYFEYHYQRIPRLIRKNRNSLAILDGTEGSDELKALAGDVFEYFGLGCRNVSKILVPDSYPLEDLARFWDEYQGLINHIPYKNNYRHLKAILQTEKIPFMDSTFFLFQENHRLSSPIGAVYYQTYYAPNEITEYLLSNKDKIQCIVNHKGLAPKVVNPGRTQNPDLWDYADNFDTLKFLL